MHIRLLSGLRHCGFRPEARVAAGLLLGGLAFAASGQSFGEPDQVSGPGAQRPRWEAGVAGVALTVPDYPAADHSRLFALPLPYFVYHGRVLRADEDGSRLRRKLNPNLEIDISGGGALASDSSGSGAREGMPDLDYLLQLGPNLRASFGAPDEGRFVLNLPVRGVLSAGSNLQWRGVVFAPELAHITAPFWQRRLSLQTSLIAQFASSRLHEYYYEVKPEYATPERPAYEASAGYLGASFGVRASYAVTAALRVFVGARYFRYDGAANVDSPLYRSDDGASLAAGFYWALFHSSEPAED